MVVFHENKKCWLNFNVFIANENIFKRLKYHYRLNDILFLFYEKVFLICILVDTNLKNI